MAISEFDFDSVKRALADEIKRSKIAPTQLSQRISRTNKSLVKNILDDGNDIRLSTLTKLAEELGVNVAEFIPWARPNPILTIEAGVIRDMLEAAMRELPVGATVEDYLRVVPEGLRARLETYLADGGSRGSQAGAISLDKDAPTPAPTKQDAGV